MNERKKNKKVKWKKSNPYEERSHGNTGSRPNSPLPLPPGLLLSLNSSSEEQILNETRTFQKKQSPKSLFKSIRQLARHATLRKEAANSSSHVERKATTAHSGGLSSIPARPSQFGTLNPTNAIEGIKTAQKPSPDVRLQMMEVPLPEQVPIIFDLSIQPGDDRHVTTIKANPALSNNEKCSQIVQYFYENALAKRVFEIRLILNTLPPGDMLRGDLSAVIMDIANGTIRSFSPGKGYLYKNGVLLNDSEIGTADRDRLLRLLFTTATGPNYWWEAGSGRAQLLRVWIPGDIDETSPESNPEYVSFASTGDDINYGTYNPSYIIRVVELDGAGGLGGFAGV